MAELMLLMLGAVLCLVLFLIVRKKRVARNDTDELGAQGGTADNSRNSQVHEQENIENEGQGQRIFTLSELRMLNNEFSWDESGCVFKINPDGSVSVAGRFNPEELNVDPDVMFREQMIASGLLDMLPPIWTHFIDNRGPKMTAEINHQDYMFYKPGCSCADLFNNIGRILVRRTDESSLESLVEYKAGIVVLVVLTSYEYAMALGAISCFKRLFGNKIRVTIALASELGALAKVIDGPLDVPRRVSWAYGKGEEYSCVGLFMDQGVIEETSIRKKQMILPHEGEEAYQTIMRGALAYSIMLNKCLDAHDMVFCREMPFPIEYALKQGNAILKRYPFLSCADPIPTARQLVIDIKPGQTIAYHVGGVEILPDILGYSIPDVVGEIKLEFMIEAHHWQYISIKHGSDGHKICINELIG